eukprot:c9311_g1_i2.p1 GENE.c9311_g1_i2~~c9311_g1_i2.p1  ORF type:complete len:331 (+),score=56.99 c9311_g1_i2:43-1035(+)
MSVAVGIERSRRLATPFSVHEEIIKSRTMWSSSVLYMPRGPTSLIEIFTQRWLPVDRSPIGLVFILHAINENSSRWTCPVPGGGECPVMSFVNQGFGVFGIDLEGHGRSANDLGMMANTRDAVCDVITYIEKVITERQFMNKRVFVCGTAFGGMLALSVGAVLANREVPLVHGMILIAPLLRVARQSRPSDLTKTIAKIFGAIAPSIPLVQANRGNDYHPEVSEEMEEATSNDPLFYSGKMRVGTGLALLRHLETFENDLRMFSLPLLVIHGTEDRVCAFEGSVELLDLVSSSDKTLIRYEGAAHSLEFERPTITKQLRADRIKWILERL